MAGANHDNDENHGIPDEAPTPAESGLAPVASLFDQLSPRVRRFCEILASEGDICRAVSGSGYKFNNAIACAGIGEQLLKKKEIRLYLAEVRKKALADAGIVEHPRNRGKSVARVAIEESGESIGVRDGVDLRDSTLPEGLKKALSARMAYSKRSARADEADPTEVREWLTAVMRGRVKQFRDIPSVRLKAVELLMRTKGMLVELSMTRDVSDNNALPKGKELLSEIQRLEEIVHTGARAAKQVIKQERLIEAGEVMSENNSPKEKQ